MTILKFIIFSVINYLIGSIPSGLIIGKVFYDTDIRDYGSGNMGATNAGRVLGAKSGYIVFIMDALKGMVPYLIESLIDPNVALYSVFFIAIGHCWPCFAQFKGGKGVATIAGIIIAISIGSWKMLVFACVIPLALWLIIKVKTGLVSLGSLYAVLLSAVMSTFASDNVAVTIVETLLFVLTAIRHKENIKRLLNGTEQPAGY